MLCLSGQQSVYGDLSCEGFASNGNPYVTATDGFQVEDTSRVRMATYLINYDCDELNEDMLDHSNTCTWNIFAEINDD